jgi:hypothetical protein
MLRDILRYVADAPLLGRKRRDVLAVDHDAPARVRPKTGNRFDERRLAGSRRTDERRHARVEHRTHCELEVCERQRDVNVDHV